MPKRIEAERAVLTASARAAGAYSVSRSRLIGHTLRVVR